MHVNTEQQVCSERQEKMTANDAFEAVLFSDVLQQHLLPRLSLPDLLRLMCVNTSLKQALATAPDSVWRAVSSRTVPASHSLARTGSRHAARQYAQGLGAMSSGSCVST